jgi:L,D-transpeptidase YcbB
MALMRLITAFVSTTAMLTAAVYAAPADDAEPAEATAEPTIVIEHTLYDRTTDPVTAAIREILADAGKDGAFLEKRDAAAVAEYYQEQSFAPSWTAGGQMTERARLLIDRIRNAQTDGLDPRDYHTPPMSLGQWAPAGARDIAVADVMLSQAIVKYARHAHSGRLEPSSVSSNFGYEPKLIDAVAVLSDVASADDAAMALESYNPDNREFVLLRGMLAEERATDKERPPEIAAGPSLRIGSSDPRVIVLRQRLNVTAPAEDPTVFDEAVDLAVRAYQESANLKPDGIVGPRTISMLNGAATDHVATILANMERWRWMPEDLGKFYVRVNVPNFNVDIYRDDKVVHTTRIVVGKPTNQTPIFSDQIESVVVNPVWNVPSSIAVKEMLPAARANPGSLRGYRVYANIRGRFQPIDPYQVDWNRVDMRRIQIKQPPGERNALGRVKFLFPNKYAVYLHDTPSKSLFQKDYRAYSHGCMRVMDPWEFADALVEANPDITGAVLKKMVGGGEKWVNLKHPIPVHVTYFTAWVDETGQLQLRDDVYGLDKRTEKALGV